jgi:hypothetical protein
MLSTDGTSSTGLGSEELSPAQSTVPEPGSLALTATGIVGLLPLLRRSRRRR